MGQFDFSGRSQIVTFTDPSIIPMLEDLKVQALTDFRDQCNGLSIRSGQILSRMRPAQKMTMTDLLIHDGVTGYNAEANISW